MDASQIGEIASLPKQSFAAVAGDLTAVHRRQHTHVYSDTVSILVEPEWGTGNSGGGVQLCPAMFIPRYAS